MSGIPYTLTASLVHPSTCNACDASIIVTATAEVPFLYTFRNPITVTSTNGYSYTLSDPNAYFNNNVSISPIIFTLTGLCPGTYIVKAPVYLNDDSEVYTTLTKTVVISSNQGCIDPGGNPCNLSVNVSVTACTCNGTNDGTATAVVNNYTEGYTLYWDAGEPGEDENQQINLTPGQHQVIAIDEAGCQAIKRFTILEPTPVNPNVSFIKPTDCFTDDGSITVTPSGGTHGGAFGNYNIQLIGETIDSTVTDVITKTFTDLPNGIYNIIVTDANGCTATAKVNLFCLLDLEQVIIRSKCCMADLGYKILQLKSLGNNDVKCLEDQIIYSNLAICLLERYLANNVCPDITEDNINDIINRLNDICECCPCGELPVDLKFILQEDGSFLLQENGFKFFY